MQVLVTSNRTALIEMVPNAPSVHNVKAKSPPGTSLRDHFAAKYIQGSPGFAKAQRNFVESLAAYSLVCYLLQIKDRWAAGGQGLGVVGGVRLGWGRDRWPYYLL